MEGDAWLAPVLEEARQRASLTQDELWALYWQAGGQATRTTLASYLRGQSEPLVSQYNVIAAVLNERLREVGKEPTLPILTFDGADS